MGVSGSPEILREVIRIVNELNVQSLIVTTTILSELGDTASERVLLTPHAPVLPWSAFQCNWNRPAISHLSRGRARV